MNTAFVLTHESNPQRKAKAISIIALALTRSLGRRGVPVVRVHPNRLDRSLSSRYCSQVEICPDFYASETALLEFLLEMGERYPGTRVLIPGSDDCAYFVSRHREELSRVFRVVAPGWDVMQLILDKQHQYEQAERLGVPIPETYFPTGIDEVRDLAGRLQHYPYVIKPLVAHSWRLASMQAVSGGKKGFSAANPQELLQRYEAIAAGDKHVMIQEVIGGKDERLFTFLSYFDEQSRPLGYCIRKKTRQFPIDFGYCTMTESCFDPVVEEQSIRLLKGIGYHGIAGVEWKLDPRTGIYKLIEINARAVNTIGLAPACGVDLPWLAFQDKIGADPSPCFEWEPGVKWMNLEQDFWAARTLVKLGQLSYSGWLASLRGRKVDAICAGDDLEPGWSYYFDFLRQRIGPFLSCRAPARPTPATGTRVAAPAQEGLGKGAPEALGSPEAVP